MHRMWVKGDSAEPPNDCEDVEPQNCSNLSCYSCLICPHRISFLESCFSMKLQ